MTAARLLAVSAVLVVATACGKPLPPPAAASGAIPLDGHAHKLDAVDTDKYLHYAVGTHIDAPPAIVWEVLTDAQTYTEWNSTVRSLEGSIGPDQQIALQVHIDPKRTFKLEITEWEANRRLVWEDGNNVFKGVRTFTLTPADGGTDFTMKEAFTGSMMKMIAPKLPDFAPDFEAFAADLKAETVRRSGG